MMQFAGVEANESFLTFEFQVGHSYKIGKFFACRNP